jgi:hypothetical protein
MVGQQTRTLLPGDLHLPQRVRLDFFLVRACFHLGKLSHATGVRICRDALGPVIGGGVEGGGRGYLVYQVRWSDMWL